MSEPGEGPCARLAAARVARGMSPAQAAEQMRLTTPVVLAMEEGRFRDLGPAVFARGHLRRYAALVGVPVEDLLGAYEAAVEGVAPSDLIPPASLHTPMRQPGSASGFRMQWLLVVAATAVVVAGGWWLWQARVAKPDLATEAAAEPDLPSAGPAETGPPDSDTIRPAAPAAEGQAVLEAAPPAPSVTPVPGNLNLSFAGPCWLEVYDAGGRRLAFELAEAGTVRSFGGPAPWRVVLGDARTARVDVGGQPVAIPASMILGDAALVSITDSGAVTRARPPAVPDAG